MNLLEQVNDQRYGAFRSALWVMLIRLLTSLFHQKSGVILGNGDRHSPVAPSSLLCIVLLLDSQSRWIEFSHVR